MKVRNIIARLNIICRQYWIRPTPEALWQGIRLLAASRQSLQIFLIGFVTFIFGLNACIADSVPVLAGIHLDKKHKVATISDGQGRLMLRLNYDGRCILDQVIVRGREAGSASGVCTGIRVDEKWFTTKNIVTPVVTANKNRLTVTGISFGRPGEEIHETWRFTVKPDGIVWRITRSYPTNVVLDDAAFPEWYFASLATWTGGLLDNGGVVWSKYLDKTNTTYAGHFGTV